MDSNHFLLIALIAVLLAFSVGLGIAAVKLKKQIRTAPVVTLDESLQTEVKRWKDKYDSEHSLYEITSLNYSNYKHNASAELDSLKRTLKNWKRLKNSTSVETITEGDFLIVASDTLDIENPKNIRDTVFNFSYSDEWLSYESGVAFEKQGTKLIVSPQPSKYTVANKYTLNYAWDRKGLFKPKTLTLEVVNANPNTTTGRVQVYDIKPEVRWYQKKGTMIGIGLGAGLVGGYLIAK